MPKTLAPGGIVELLPCRDRRPPLGRGGSVIPLHNEPDTHAIHGWDYGAPAHTVRYP